MPPKRPNIKSRGAQIKPKPANVQLLDRQLCNADAAIRAVGVASIPRIQAPVEPLTDSIVDKLEHQNWYIRRVGSQAAVTAIQSKDAAGVTVKDTLGTRLESTDPEIRRCAANGLTGIVEVAAAPDPPSLIPEKTAEAAAEELFKRISHQDPRVREETLKAIGKIGELARPAMKQALSRLADDDPSVRRRAVELCTSLGVVATEAVEEVATLLQHQESIFRRTGTKALIRLADHSGAQVAAAVARQLEHCPDVVHRRAILLLMVDLGPLFSPHGRTIAQMLNDSDSGIRVQATKALVAAGPAVADTCLDVVVPRMDHHDRTMRRAAVDCMREMAAISAPFARAAGRYLQEEPDDLADPTQYRMDVLRVLGGAQKHAVPFLEEMAYALEDREWAIRRAAIEALSDLGEHAELAAPGVAMRMLHHEPEVRSAAVECLGRMGLYAGEYATSVEGLLEQEEDEEVINMCKVAHKMLLESGVFEALQEAAAATGHLDP